MSEDQGPYNTQNENAAEIHPPKTIQVVQDKGLVEYRVWGWVKISAKFISHIKRLRGAKLSIWQVLACSIDENGKCSLTIKELCELTGYSHTEVIDSLRELDEMGYLSIDRSGKKNLYTPEFAARGTNKSPSETLVKKLDSTPLDSVESSPSLEKSVPSIKELKELNNDKEKQARISLFSKLYESNIGPLTPTVADMIGYVVDDFPKIEWYKKAFEIAIENNVRKLAYVRSVLQGWKDNYFGWKPEYKNKVKEKQVKASEPKGFDAIVQWQAMKGVSNGD